VAPKEKPVTVVSPKNMTVATEATGTQFALVPVRNSLELETIMKNVVADNSRDQYDTRAVGLVLWLYKDPSYRSLLLPELLEDLDKIMDGDGGGNKNLRSTIKVAIKGMNRHDINSCTIKLANLNFNCFTEYLLSLRPKKKKKKRRKRKRT